MAFELEPGLLYGIGDLLASCPAEGEPWPRLTAEQKAQMAREQEMAKRIDEAHQERLARRRVSKARPLTEAERRQTIEHIWRGGPVRRGPGRTYTRTVPLRAGNEIVGQILYTVRLARANAPGPYDLPDDYATLRAALPREAWAPGGQLIVEWDG